jgi:hypothetical protein
LASRIQHAEAICLSLRANVRNAHGLIKILREEQSDGAVINLVHLPDFIARHLVANTDRQVSARALIARAAIAFGGLDLGHRALPGFWFDFDHHFTP